MSSARDVLVTGMGYCLPGLTGPVFSPADLWNLAARGRTALTETDGVYFGSVRLTPEQFAARLPEIPGVFADHFTDVMRYGLVSMAEAAIDAKLDHRTDLSGAAILVGRGSIDANVAGYRAVAEADPSTVDASSALQLFLAGELTATPADLSLVQAAVTRSTGACFTAAAGCASSSVQLNNARLLIASGEADIAVVTGADTFDRKLVMKSRELIEAVQGGDGTIELPDTVEGLMHPYDRRAGVINYGEGAGTVILESREHAEARGAHVYGRVVAQSLARDGLTHPLTGDYDGTGLVMAVRRCLGEEPLPPYVHGGSDGDPQVTAFESAGLAALYGDRPVLMSSHEGVWGHNGASAGAIGVGLTLLMMERGEVCPTALCEEPAEGLSFDPVPGTGTRPLEFDRALVLTYQIGGVKSALLLGGDR